MKDKNFTATVTILLTFIFFFLIIIVIKNNKNKISLNSTISYDKNEANYIEPIDASLNNEKKEKNEKKITKKKETKPVIIIYEDEEVLENDSKEDSKLVNDETNGKEIIVETKNEEVYSPNDLKLINELQNIDESIKSKISTENTKKTLKICKGVFITYVDFLFFDGEINGVKFDELTIKGKEKALTLINKTDEYIESKYPGYKEDISSSTKEAFNKASSLIKNGAKKINDFGKEKLGDENYNSIIESKDDFVSFTKSASNVIKNISINLYDKTKSKLYNWYIDFKNK